jgi:hypothetical protein
MWDDMEMGNDMEMGKMKKKSKCGSFQVPHNVGYSGIPASSYILGDPPDFRFSSILSRLTTLDFPPILADHITYH